MGCINSVMSKIEFVVGEVEVRVLIVLAIVLILVLAKSFLRR